MGVDLSLIPIQQGGDDLFIHPPDVKVLRKSLRPCPEDQSHGSLQLKKKRKNNKLRGEQNPQNMNKLII